MGHADYKTLQKYVRLATERDLGSPKEWAEFILRNHSGRAGLDIFSRCAFSSAER